MPRHDIMFDKSVVAKYACKQIVPLIEENRGGLLLITGLSGTGKTAVLQEIYNQFVGCLAFVVMRKVCCGVVAESRVQHILQDLQDNSKAEKRILLLDDVHNVRDLRKLDFMLYPDVLTIATTDQLTASAIELNENKVIAVYDITMLNYPLFKKAYKDNATIDTYIENMGSICCAVDSTEYLARGLDLLLYSRTNLKQHTYAFLRDIPHLIRHEFDYIFYELTKDLNLLGQRKYSAIKRRYLCDNAEGSTDFEVIREIFTDVSLYINVGEPVMVFGSQVCRLLTEKDNKDVTQDYAQKTEQINGYIYERLYRLLVLFELYRRFGATGVYGQTKDNNIVINDKYIVAIKERSDTARNETKVDKLKTYIVVYGGETVFDGEVRYVNYVEFFEDSAKFFT